MTPHPPKLRFAPLVRVSTEGQERQGESLRTQRTRITQAVERCGGTIDDYCWEQYGGQEHATDGFERAKLDQLLTDAAAHKFDAVMVDDVSRWSRHNTRSEDGLRILRDARVRFYVLAMEYDLYNPEHRNSLRTGVNMNQFFAEIQAYKSIINRIERAKRGIPSNGRLPFGRTFDHHTETWDIVPDDRDMIRRCAERYISGENIKTIATSVGRDRYFLMRNMTKNAGTQWTLRFRRPEDGIDETIVLTIPPLLPPEMIAAVERRRELNKTTKRGHRKYRFLLTGFVFCAGCGYRLGQYMNRRNYRYYRHRTVSSGRNASCVVKRVFPAAELEKVVLLALATMLGDTHRVKDAIDRATPKFSEFLKLQNELDDLHRQTTKLTARRERLVDRIADGLLTDQEAKGQLERIRQDMATTDERAQVVEERLKTMPNPADVKRAGQWSARVTASITRDNPRWLLRKDFAYLRRFVEQAFDGRNADGTPYGVYVSVDNDNLLWEIRGAFTQDPQPLSLTDADLFDAFNIDPDYENPDDVLQRGSSQDKRPLEYRLFGHL